MIPLLWGNVQCETLEETVEKARLMLPDTSHPTHLSQSCIMDLLEFSGANLQSQKQLSNITKWFRKRWLLYMSQVGPVVRTTACCPTRCAAALCRVLTGLFVAQVSSQPWNIKRDSSHWLYDEPFAGDAPQFDYKPLCRDFLWGRRWQRGLWLDLTYSGATLEEQHRGPPEVPCSMKPGLLVLSGSAAAHPLGYSLSCSEPPFSHRKQGDERDNPALESISTKARKSQSKH